MIRFFLVLLITFYTGLLYAQSAGDSLRPKLQDSTGLAPADDTTFSAFNNIDSLLLPPPLDSGWKTKINPYLGKSFKDLAFLQNTFFAFNTPAFTAKSDIKVFKGKESVFYVLVALLIIFALLRTAFAKYLNDLFRLFFRRTLKQRQITEQLSQTPLPSLVLNSFFIVTAGLYLAFLLQHFSLGNQVSFWLLTLYAAAAIGAMYLVKFLTLKFTGWVLNLSAATDSYIFIVFIINKVIGIFLLPFLVLLAFSQGDLYQIAITLSWFGIGALFVYRFILSYSAVHKQIRVKPFHFIVYLLAFEIVPLLLIYKLAFYFLF